MKKIYLILFFVAASIVGTAQNVNITFKVNTANITVDAAGIFLAGGTNFGAPGDNPLTDADADGVWEITIVKPAGALGNYIFLNGNCGDWSCKEQMAGKSCADGQYNDRLLPTITSDTTLMTCFEECSTDGSCPTATATAPTSGAAAPTYNDTSVISMFSGPYTDVTVDTWRTGWSNATFSGTNVDGDSVHLYENLDFVGIEATGANSIDASSMEHFNADVWTPNATIFRIKLVDFGADNAFGGGDDTEHELVFENPMMGSWVNYHIDLADFTNLTGKTSISQIILSAAPAGSAKVYIDNVFFSKEPTESVPMTAAVDPTDAEADVISLFSGVYTDITVDTWRTSWSNATLEDVQVDGNDVKKYTMLDFVGIETVGENSIDASTMEHITFDAWTANATTYRIKLVDFGADNGFGGGDDTEHETVFEMPATETWTNHKIALADMTGLTATSNVSQIIFSALPTADVTLYLDNIYFSKPESNTVKEEIFSTFNVYPNPATDVINIDLSAKSGIIHSFQITNISGQTVASQEVNSPVVSQAVNITNLTAGVYFIKVNAEQGVFTQRVIVK
jgi:hypothetical protein